MTKDKWFESWFDTDYYHLLYQHRDLSEATDFVRRLVKYLQPESGSRFCDLACGIGRHSRVVGEMGYEVVGLDLSENNIELARKEAGSNLSFQVHDMRASFGENRFDYVLNLFTSFGYFDTDQDHFDTIKNIADGLKSGGMAVIDYLNVNFVQKSLVRASVESRDGVDFHVRRLLSDKHIIKEIKVVDGQNVRYFEERVRRFDLHAFNKMLTECGLKLESVFGDYRLNSFESETSPRLIMLASK